MSQTFPTGPAELPQMWPFGLSPLAPFSTDRLSYLAAHAPEPPHWFSCPEPERREDESDDEHQNLWTFNRSVAWAVTWAKAVDRGLTYGLP